MLEQYEVVLRHKKSAARWSLMFKADDFGHAQEQAYNYLDSMEDGKAWGKEWEIIRIEKDYGE